MNMSKFFQKIKRFSLISLSLTVILSAFVFASPVSAATNTNIWNGKDMDSEFAGSGTAADPYKITSAAELYAFALRYCGEGLGGYTRIDSEGKYFVLTNDIYLNNVSDSNWMNSSPNKWVTFNKWVANTAINAFRGNFDGLGHTVYGLYFEVTGENQAVTGLFPYAGGNAVISNVNIKNAYAAKSSYSEAICGGIVGMVNKNPDGSASNVNVTKCVADDTCDFSQLSGVLAGGIIGTARESSAEITYCGSAVNFNSISQPAGKGGGIIGNGSGWATKSLKIKNSYVVAAFTTGMPGSFDYDAVSDGTVYTTHAWWTSLVDFVCVPNNRDMMGTVALTSMPDLGWDVWQANDGAYPTIKGSTSYIKPKYDIWDGTTAVTYAGGSGTVTDPYLISTPEQLKKMVTTDEVGKYYSVTNDIYLNDVSNYQLWYGNNPKGVKYWRDYSLNKKSFVGHIEGNGHAVYGLLHSEGDNGYFANSGLYAGLIPNIGVGSSISNLHIRKSLVCAEYAGALIGTIGGTAGFSEGTVTVTGCSADETVYVYGLHTGGLIGCAQAGLTVDNCYSAAVLAGDSSKGGIYGDAWGGNPYHIIKNSYSSGAYPVAMNSNNKGAKLPEESKRVYENVYSLYKDYEQENWEGIMSVSDYSEMTGLGDNWYGSSTKLPANRCKAAYDINADGSSEPDSGDIAELRRLLLASDEFNTVCDCNNDGAFDIRDLIRIKGIAAGFFA